MAVTNKISALLVFPPGYEAYFMPEIALPRLKAFLEREGESARLEDWAARYWHEHIFRDEVLPRWLARLKRDHRPAEDCFFFPVTELYRRFLDRSRFSLGACRDHLFEHRKEIFAWLYEEEKVEDFSPEGVMGLVRKRNPVLDAFLVERCRETLERCEPSLLGLSIISGQQLPWALKLAAIFKRLRPEVPVVAGGPWVKLGATFFDRPGYGFLFDFMDFLCTSDGEEPLLGLLGHLEGDRPVEEAPNLVFRHASGEVRRTPARASPTVDSLPAPDFDGFPLEIYPDHTLPIERASRCYWGKCSFCWHNHKDRAFAAVEPAEVVVRVREYVEEHGVRHFVFCDNAVDQGYMRSLATGLIEADLGPLRWDMNSRLDPEFKNPEHCRLLRRSGCEMIFFGLETVNRRHLRGFRKGISMDDVPLMLRSCGESGLVPCVYIIVYPHQTLEDLKDTLRFCLEHRRHLGMVIMQRFMLNEYCIAFDEPERLAIEVAGEPQPTLDFFDLPYETSAAEVSDDELEALEARFYRLMREVGELDPEAAL